MNAVSERIVINPDVLNGKPSIRGTRISVQTVLEYLSAGDSIEEVLDNYPSLTREDVLACIGFASNLLGHNFIIDRS